MSEKQKTLRKEYIFEGKGLHSGARVRMKVAPAPEDSGIRFLREDIGSDAVIEAVADYVTVTQRGTTLEKGEVKVSTIEHLLSALSGLGVDNALVTLDSQEAPILDGSALPYVRAIVPDGLAEQDAPVRYLEVDREVRYRDEKTGSEIVITPAGEFSVDLTIDFNSHVLGVQRLHYDKGVDYASEIAPCRTFVFFHELEFLFKNNLIKGGDLENAIVIVERPVPEEDLARMASLFNVDKVDRLPEGYLDNVRLHFPDECARHKMLDLIGDFSLVGRRIKGHVVAGKSGHKINTTVAGILRDEFLKNRQ
ncbi:MAG TPA: UDP-3-O-acyl-N-acetylglucosamine deacetylase [Candidatus Coprenecus stercoravium]|uniref:UDP-3-O-acyl-N-acetylglucosamine deacetylase n=1 Tax=Candidatus Coprenecus stercoravium TaxID=2840735 RepID=A0A9D2GRE3_9BACT|nr:UDP-3-O-acyl-N-acetylglucosamine deacetylase [Candidatus Coprenecus stercoravium]